MDIQKIVVVGGGLMGNGIAQVVAQAGFEVTIVDVEEAALEKALKRIDRSLERLVISGSLTKDEAGALRARLATTTDLEGAAQTADHVIECVIEDEAIKADVLGRLDRACRPEVIFASNTSQISISKLGAATSRPDRVIGSHWFNPPPVMKLIEVVRGVATSDETLDTTLELCRRYGKETVVCNKDARGFVTSRLFTILMVEAARIVEEGIASAEDVNKACVLAFNHAQGPLDTGDLTGLETVERVADGLVDHFGERFLPTQSWRALVQAGHHGRKTGRGFRIYEQAT